MHAAIRKVFASIVPRPLQLRLRCWHAARVVTRFTDSDWPESPLIRALVKPGDTVIDVGANMGYITARLASYVGSAGQVYSVEPIPDTFAQLQRAVQALGARQVTAIHACASNRSGVVRMEIPHFADGGENLYEAHVVTGERNGTDDRIVEVRSVRLDDLLADGAKPVRFMKIDVEGHERDVLEGASDVLQRCKPALFIEIAGDPDDEASSAGRVFADLSGLGYQAFWWTGSILKSREPGDNSVDYFFLQPPHLARVSDWIPTSGRISDLGQCSQEPR